MDLCFLVPAGLCSILSRLQIPLLTTLRLVFDKVLGFKTLYSRANFPNLTSLTIEYEESCGVYEEEKPICEIEHLLAAMPDLHSLNISGVSLWHPIAAAMNPDPLPIPRLEDVVVEDSHSLEPLVSVFEHRSGMQCPVYSLTFRQCKVTPELKSAFEQFVGSVLWVP